MNDFVAVDKTSAFREGKIRRYFVGGKEIGVLLWNGRWHAFSNRCTHDDFQMHFGFVEDDCLNCPIHYAVFDLETGKRVSGPGGIDDLPVYQARASGEDVEVSLTPPAAVRPKQTRVAK